MDIIKEIEDYNRENFKVSLDKESVRLLCFLAKLLNVKKVLEIGTGIGYSAINLGFVCNVVSIDNDERNVEIAKKFIEKSGLKNIKIISGNALNEIPKLDEKFDLLFIDAMMKEYLEYLKLALDKLNDNALIVADNTISHKEKMKDYLEYVENNFETMNLDVGKGLSLSFKK